MSDFLDLQGAKDLNTDAIHLSAVANSKDPVTGAPIDTHVNRVGDTNYTLAGLYKALVPVVTAWTFTTGGTLNYQNEVALNPADGNYYGWSGSFPKTVAPGTDPANVPGYVRRYSPSAPTGGDSESAKEALRRSYADAGLIVKGYTKDGATLTSIADVVIHNISGKGYSWGGVYPVGGYIVTPETDPTLDVNFVDKSGETTYLATSNPMPLAYFGADRNALVNLLGYAKTTGLPVRLTSDVLVDTPVDIDFAGAKLDIDFCGYSLLSDVTCLTLRNLAPHSVIKRPSLKNVTAPWCITRWDGDNWIVSSSTVLASLQQTNNLGFYQPSSNDSDIWSSLSTEVQTQNISPRMLIRTSTDVKMYQPSGRFCLYEFDMCHRCEVFQPDISIGGKGTYGTILFKNLDDAGYGFGNKVHGGRVGYGTFSSVCFMRNKFGGVDSGFVPYRCGESGVKTYQNEVNGRSARCYSMTFSDIFPFQTQYDGVDFNSDYGTAVERVDDFTLAQYPWNQLPTCHKVNNVQSTRCRGVGVWGDGQFNNYTDCSATQCRAAGIHLKLTNSVVESAYVNECNITNSSNTHQLTVVGNGNSVIAPHITTSTAITTGYAIYMTGTSSLLDEVVRGNLQSTLASRFGAKSVDSLRVGSGDTTENVVTIDMHPRRNTLSNAIAQYAGVLQIGTSGAETGYALIRSTYNGSLVHGLKALPQNGGVGVMAAGTALDTSMLSNSELGFYMSGSSIYMAYKLANGTYGTKLIV